MMDYTAFDLKRIRLCSAIAKQQTSSEYQVTGIIDRPTSPSDSDEPNCLIVPFQPALIGLSSQSRALAPTFESVA
jgi:hypothetical protein